MLPLVLGIGVNYGVQVMHDYRSRSGPYEMSGSVFSTLVLTCRDLDRGLWQHDDRFAPRPLQPGAGAGDRHLELPVRRAGPLAVALERDLGAAEGRAGVEQQEQRGEHDASGSERRQAALVRSEEATTGQRASYFALACCLLGSFIWRSTP